MAGRRANSAYMLLGQIVGKAGLFGSLMIFSRILEDGAFGELLLSVSIGLIVVFLSDMGVSMLVTRRIATGEPVNSVFTAALVTRTVLSSIALAVVMLSVSLAGYSSRQILLVFLVSSAFVLNGYCESAFALFRAREQMVYEGAARILHGLLGIGLALYALYSGRGVVFAGSTYILREIPALVFAGVALVSVTKFRPDLRRESLGKVRPLFAAALPLGLAGIMIAAGQRLDGVFIKAFLGDAAIAAYQQCLKLLEALVLIVTPTLLPGALFPVLCLAVKKGWGEARMRVAWMTELFLVLAFLLIIPLWAGEDHVLRTVWGEDFLRGSSPGDVGMTYRLVLLTLPVAYMFNMFMSTTIATERQRKVLPAVFFPLMMEMALFLLLIPFLGIVGAALSHMAFLASGAVWMAWNLHGRYGSTGFLRGARRPLISFIPAFIILLLSPLEGILNGVLAVAAFLAVWISFGGLGTVPVRRS